MKNIENIPKLETVSMEELYDRVYPVRPPLIEGLLYPGTYFFVGAPKFGKSFFMAQLGYHISLGLDLWGFKARKGTVLYLALEDEYSRLQKRLSKMFGTEGSENFFLATRAQTLKDGLDVQLENFISGHKEASLIIIDTLQKVREIGGESYGYASDYDIVTRLKEFGDKYGLCILVVHHTRKMEASDSFEMISGTNGLLGAADGAFVIQKDKRTDNKAVLEITGRDQQDLRLFLEFDRENCTWKLTKMDTELWKEPSDPVLEVIAEFMKLNPIWESTATELINNIGDISVSPNTLTRKLNVCADKLLLDYGIAYKSFKTHEGRRVSLKLIKHLGDDM